MTHANRASIISIIAKGGNRLLLCSLCCLILTGSLPACKKDREKGVQTTDEDDMKSNPDYQGAQTIYITNEGTFNKGNASLTRYKPVKGSLKRQFFKEKNGRPLGDVFHSMHFHEHRAYLVINNSGKIEVVDSATFQSLGTIRNLPSPRYIMPLGNGKAYVSNFTLGSDSEISLVNLNTYQRSGAISTGGWTEQMVKANGRVWAAEVDKGALLIINPDKHQIMDTINLRKQLKEVVKDRNGMIWALSTGGLDDQHKPVLYQINPANKQIEQQLTFPQKADQPGNLTFNKRKDTLYFINRGVFRLAIRAGMLPTKPLIREPANRNFYGLGIDPVNGRLFVSDALDYVQRGLIFSYKPGQNKAVDTFKAGTIPSDFQFIP